MLFRGYPWVPSQNVSPFGPAVWPAIGNIYGNVLFYYIDDLESNILIILKINYFQLRSGHWFLSMKVHSTYGTYAYSSLQINIIK